MKKLYIFAFLSLVGVAASASELECVKELQVTITGQKYTEHSQKLSVKCGGSVMAEFDGVKVMWDGTRDVIISKAETVAIREVPQSGGSAQKALETVRRQIVLPGPLPDTLAVPFGEKTVVLQTLWKTEFVANSD